MGLGLGLALGSGLGLGPGLGLGLGLGSGPILDPHLAEGGGVLRADDQRVVGRATLLRAEPLSKARLKRVSSMPVWDPVC